MKDLSELPNIGTTMKNRLAAVGINDIETLFEMGSKEAYTKLFLQEGDTCLCSLYGLEGAIQGIRWHDLAVETKEELKVFFNTFK